MTLREIRDRVYTLLGEDAASPIHFSDAELNRWINDSYRKLARETKVLEEKFDIALTAGTQEYDLPIRADRVYRVYLDDDKIFPTTQHQLDRFDENWETESGGVCFYTLDKLGKNKIRLYRAPDTSRGVTFDSDLGTVIDTTKTALTENFRFESDDVSLGTVVDFVQGSDTTVFAIAASGGGSDADYGIVVSVSSDDTSDSYTFPTSELGTIVDIDDTSSAEYDAERFLETRAGTADDDTRDSELGVVTDIDESDNANTYQFVDQDGGEFSQFSFDVETGTVVDVSNSVWTSETGTMVTLAEKEQAIFSSEVGIPVAIGEMELGLVIDITGIDGLEVWAKLDPEDIIDDEEPRLPEWTHQSLTYMAASRALRKNSEIRNPALADAYQVLAAEQEKFIKKLGSNRMPEKVRRMREPDGDQIPRRFVRLPSTFPQVRR